MNIFSISWLNLISKPLATLLSVLLLTLGVAMISILLLLDRQMEDVFNKNLKDIHMVVGAKGSPLQLILSSVYHIQAPNGNIPLDEAQAILNNPVIEKGIPLSFGDNYKGFRIVGTDSSYLQHYAATMQSGQIWEQPLEVVLGASIQQKLQLDIGDTFEGDHGLIEGATTGHIDHNYRVVGILEPNGSVLDQLILTGLESVWQIHAHEEEQDTVEHKPEITSMLVKFREKSKGLGLFLPRQINENTQMHAALPAVEIKELQENLGIGTYLFRRIAMAIIIISAISVFISLFNSLRERKYELALMRSLGASRLRLFSMVLLEGLFLSIIGYLFGMAASRVGMVYLNDMAESTYRYSLSPWEFLPGEIVLGIACIGIGIFASLIPALQAFFLNISQTLADA